MKWLLTIRRHGTVIGISVLVIVGIMLIIQNFVRISFLTHYGALPSNVQQRAILHNHKESLINRREPLSNASDQVDLHVDRFSAELIDSRDFKSFYEDVKPQLSPETRTLALKLKNIVKCQDHKLIMEKLQYGDYWVAKNYIRGTVSKSVSCAETITYTTNGDYTFMGSLPQVVKRWLAPVSFALFAPGYDTSATLDSIQFIRNCVPESDLIRKYVTFHIYFPAAHMPKYLPIDEFEVSKWPYNCNVTHPPYENVNRTEMYKTVKNLTYPINVGRNIARKAVNTYFIFACDIELMPSPGLVQQFLQMIALNGSLISSDTHRRVFALPVFELHKNATIPNDKSDLEKLLHTKKAIPFHSKICVNCHLVPKQGEWVNATYSNHNKSMYVFSATKRENKFRYWEPFYISDNREPMFDERVTWEGQSNKRIQGHAMCLLHYEYQILYPAFLVHSPGIKYFNKKSPRLKYVAPMNYLIKHTIEPEYRILYGVNSKCRT